MERVRERFFRTQLNSDGKAVYMYICIYAHLLEVSQVMF